MKYNHQKIEPKWQKKWFKEKIYEPNLKKPKGKGKFYNLMMFPYPSAEGLHVGNMYAFTGSDIYGRFKRMWGYDVFEPIGLDGFGIHSENFAFKVGRHPMDHAKISEKNFYRQLQMIGNGFAWDEKLETYDPEYYKWTQWIFVQMFKNGLAYRKKAAVNWCPSCLTVLADEQALNGECERCETEVVKKELDQWFFKITKYAEKLLANIPKIDWSERVKIAQANWIGRSEGTLISFELKFDARTNAGIQRQSALSQCESATLTSVKVFTTRPDTLMGATYLVLSPEHELIEKLKAKIKNSDDVNRYIESSIQKTEVDRIAEGREKTGVELVGVKAINPGTKEAIPVWVADYVLSGYGTGAIMAVPAHDERDAEFAKKFGLPFGDAPLIDKDEAIKKVNGKKIVSYHLRDWLISRQRYWGPPIPMIYCEKCDWQPVPEKDLPVLLPKIENFKPTGTEKSPLALVEKFYKTKCPKCKGEAKRETDVSDTFLDSAWYYLRYSSVKDKKNPWNSDITKKWLPVDMYIGGAEHSVLHLLYSRFLAMAFKDFGLVNFEEPFTKFRAHGLLIKDGAKMSKSKGNIVNPDEYIKKYGADTMRLFLMFLGPYEQGGDFRDSGIAGITRFLNRVWKLVSSANYESAANLRIRKFVKNSLFVDKLLHKTVKKVTEDIENLKYNTAISELMKFLNEAEKAGFSREQYKTFLKLLAPFAPHMTEEIWRDIFGHKNSIHKELWPEFDPELVVENEIDLIVQINGKTRDIIKIPRDLPEKEVRQVVTASKKVHKHLEGKTVKKVIYIKNRLVNIVV